jgi:phenylalanyl-tRNA synthetase beta chain
MLISYNWLREITDTSMTPLELRERLTAVGLAIDAVDQRNGDSVLDVEVPSNRPDCLSHIGIAREVAVINKSKVQSPKSKVIKTKGQSSDFASVEIADEDLCPRYAARVVRGVKIGPSPDWLANRLEEIGQRPINNVADITNYVLHEMGQPLHAFDLAKLAGPKIVVRRARDGEKLQTLDGVERNLDSDMLVIADAKDAVALAGVMGGLDSEIADTTTDVLIESAYFNPDSVRRTARKLGMDTEASRRFERGADCENVLNAQARCIELICEIAGGTAAADPIDVYPNPLPARVVEFRPSKVQSLTSVSADESDMTRILKALGFRQTDATANSYIVPSWRVDVSIEEDLVEEVARHIGYDKIGSELPPSNMAGEYQPHELKRRSMRRVLTNLGFDEAINFSFIDVSFDDQFEPIPEVAKHANVSGYVTLENPIVENGIRMRPTLVSSLLNSLRTNLNHGNRDVNLFEIGRVFAGVASEPLPVERDALCLICTGAVLQEGRAQGARPMDFYDVKGALEAAVDAMKLGPLNMSAVNVKHLRQGQAASIALADGSVIGSMGRLSDQLASAYKFRQPVYVAELDLTTLLESSPRTIQYHPLPRYPSVVRDLTLLLDRHLAFAELQNAIESEHQADYSGVKLVGTYEGTNIPEGKRSLTIRIEYRSEERTLRDDEIELRHRQLIDSLLTKFNATLH